MNLIIKKDKNEPVIIIVNGIVSVNSYISFSSDFQKEYAHKMNLSRDKLNEFDCAPGGRIMCKMNYHHSLSC